MTEPAEPAPTTTSSAECACVIDARILTPAWHAWLRQPILRGAMARPKDLVLPPHPAARLQTVRSVVGVCVLLIGLLALWTGQIDFGAIGIIYALFGSLLLLAGIGSRKRLQSVQLVN